MDINFQQNLVNKLVIFVHTNVFSKNRKLQKFATTNSIFFKSTISDMHHRKTYMYINFQQNRVSRSVKTVHTNLFANCINLQLAIRILKKSRDSDMHYPLTDIQANFEINRPMRIKLPRKNYFRRRQTDGQTSCETIGSFFEKKKLLKIVRLQISTPIVPLL